MAGGWACEALVGEQSREHADLELVVPDAQAPRAFEALQRRGFSIYERRQAALLNCAVELIDRSRRRIALHLVEVDGAGRGDWSRSLRAAGAAVGQECQELFGTGGLDGRRVRCMSAAAQLVLHTGYPPG